MADDKYNFKFIQINDFSANNLHFKFNANQMNNQNQYCGTIHDGNDNIIIVTNEITCKHNPIGKINGKFIKSDADRTCFKIYDGCESSNIVFEKFEEVDNYVMNNKNDILKDLQFNINLSEYIPIVKEKQTFCVNSDDDEEDKNIIYQKYITIKFKMNYDTNELQTRIWRGTMINNKYIGKVLNHEIKTITDLTKIFNYRSKFRMFLKFKKIWCNRDIQHRFGIVVECVRLDIIDDLPMNERLDNYAGIQLKDCKEIMINGEKKKAIDLGNGIIKILNKDDENNLVDNKPINKLNDLKIPSKNNISSSNNKILSMLNQ